MAMLLNQSQWETRVSDAYSTVRLSKMHFDQELAHLDKTIQAEILSTTGQTERRRYTLWMQGFVAGLCRAQVALNYREHLEFCYLVDGVLYSTHKQSLRRKTEEFYARDEGHILTNSPSGHVWKLDGKLPAELDKIYSGFGKVLK